VVPIEVDTSEPKKPSDEGKWWAQWRFVMTGMIIVAILAGLTLWVHFGRNTETASKEKTAFPLPEYPSIAVLPFANLNGDPKQDYLSDGITNEIISGLSKVPRLFVIASNSSFSYKGKPVMVQQAAKDLGVKYILEGSVQTNDGRIRIMAQLINGLSGAHLWAERYDRDLTDLFDLQDEIMMKVVESLQVLLTDGERARIYARGTKNFEAYTKFLKAREILRRYNKEDTLLSRKISEEVIALDPNYPSAYAALGENYRVEARWLKGEAKEQAQRKAIQLLEKANAMDPSQASAIGMLGYVYTEMKQYEKGMAEAEKAVAVNPNDTDAVGTLGVVLTYNGRFKDALKAFEKASRLNPLPPMWYHYWTACANLGAGRYEESISQFMKLEEFRRKKDHTSVQLVAAYILSGREEEARKEAEDILNENPKFSLEQVFMGFPFFTYKDQKYVGFLKAAALKAGLP
jgi:adenylate cyclase